MSIISDSIVLNDQETNEAIEDTDLTKSLLVSPMPGEYGVINYESIIPHTMNIGTVICPETQGMHEIRTDPTFENCVPIPDEPEQKRFSMRKLWAFTGPGFLMSIAYLDPGNIESDLQSGAIANYKLLWVLLSAHVLGFILQRLSARLGVVSGRHMAEVAYEYYPKIPRIALWIMIEIAIIGSDMQEVIGTAIAFSLLSNGRIPLWLGVIVTMADTFTFLMFDKYGFRKLEVLFALLIATMAFSFGYEFVVVGPELDDMFKGMLVPWYQGYGRREFLQGVSIVGAVIMPHNLYLHSALVKTRKIDRSKKSRVSEANMYYFIESGLALFCSFVINVLVVAVFAHGLYHRTNSQVHSDCKSSQLPPHYLAAFPVNDHQVTSDIYRGGLFLGCRFGMFALYIWAIGILAAGQSSTMTGTYAGQFVMEGFLHIKWLRWQRVLVTRSLAIGPTLLVALMAQGVGNLTGMNDLLNAVQMVQLPFALLPILAFTSSERIMREFRTGFTYRTFVFFVAVVVIAINMFFLNQMIHDWLSGKWYIYLVIPLLSAIAFFYVIFVAYLGWDCLQVLDLLCFGKCQNTRLFPVNTDMHIDAPWRNEGKLPECQNAETDRNGRPIFVIS